MLSALDDRSNMKFFPLLLCPRPPSQGRAYAAVAVIAGNKSKTQAVRRLNLTIALITTADCFKKVSLLSGSDPVLHCCPCSPPNTIHCRQNRITSSSQL